jgi:hypothetical protein
MNNALSMLLVLTINVYATPQIKNTVMDNALTYKLTNITVVVVGMRVAYQQYVWTVDANVHQQLPTRHEYVVEEDVAANVTQTSVLTSQVTPRIAAIVLMSVTYLRLALKEYAPNNVLLVLCNVPVVCVVTFQVIHITVEAETSNVVIYCVGKVDVSCAHYVSQI